MNDYTPDELAVSKVSTNNGYEKATVTTAVIDALGASEGDWVKFRENDNGTITIEHCPDECKHCEKPLGAGYICDDCERKRDGWDFEV